MSEIQSCLARFASAVLVGSPNAEQEARRAIDALVSSHAASPLSAISKLYDLLDAFRDLKIASRVGAAIEDDILERIIVVEQAMLARAATPRSEASKLLSGGGLTRSC